MTDDEPWLRVGGDAPRRQLGEHLLLPFLAAYCDSNAVYLIYRGLYHMEHHKKSHRRLFASSCYAVTPATAIPEAWVACIKGKPHYDDFNIFPGNWGGGAESCIAAMAEGPEMILPSNFDFVCRFCWVMGQKTLNTIIGLESPLPPYVCE